MTPFPIFHQTHDTTADLGLELLVYVFQFVVVAQLTVFILTWRLATLSCQGFSPGSPNMGLQATHRKARAAEPGVRRRGSFSNRAKATSWGQGASMLEGSTATGEPLGLLMGDVQWLP
jgi:hypothetical protein